VPVPIFLLGYDIEAPPERSEETRHFLNTAGEMHRNLGAPCTFFVCGKTLEANAEEFRKVRRGYPFIDIQQHTYSHILLKSLVQKLDSPWADGDTGKVFLEKGTTVYKGESLQRIAEEVSKTSALLKDILGVECAGLTTPYGFYRGLADRPDILEILDKLGIKFVRSWSRNENDWVPLSLDIQPFFYGPQGFGRMMEFPVQDGHIKRRITGWKKHGDHFKVVKKELDYAARRGLVYSYAQHDWDSIKEDPGMELTARIVEYAKDAGMEIMTYSNYYKRRLKDA